MSSIVAENLPKFNYHCLFIVRQLFQLDSGLSGYGIRNCLVYQKLMKEQVRWQKINFAGNIALMALILILLLIILFVLYKLDSVDFFMNLIE